MVKKGITNKTYTESTIITNNTDVVNKSVYSETTKIKNKKQLFEEYLGVGKWFLIFCLIMIFVTPIYSELTNYKWQREKVGNTYIYTNPNTDVYEDYLYLGNKMLGGLTNTVEVLGSIGNITDKVFNFLGNLFDIGNGESEDKNNDGTPDNLEDTLFDPCYVNPNIGSCIGA